MTSTLQSIQQTLADFVRQTAGWEDEVWALVDAGLVDAGLVDAGLVDAGTEPAGQRVTVEELERQLLAVERASEDRHDALLRRHDAFAKELRQWMAQLKGAASTGGVAERAPEQLRAPGEPAPDRPEIATLLDPTGSQQLIDVLLAQLAACEDPVESSGASAEADTPDRAAVVEISPVEQSVAPETQ